MVILTTVKQAIIEKGKRILKVLAYGKSDIRTAKEAMPWGVDSQPIDGTPAVYVGTSSSGVNIVVGYVNKSQQAGKGEYRTYSTDGSGAVVAYTWLKSNGTLELNGDDDNAVRYSKLEDAFNEFKTDFNDFLTAFNSHTHATAGTGTPSPPTAIPGSIPALPTNADITPAKIDNIKVPGAGS